MAYFAQLDDNNIVIRVLAVNDNDAPDPAPNDEAGNAFLNSIGLTGRWVQTSYHGNIRGHYAGIGHHYDDTLDIFVAPQPFPSWTMTADGWWAPPIPCPTDNKPYAWDETNQTWVLLD